MHYTYNIEYLFSKNPFSPEIEKKRIEKRGRGAEEEEGESGGRGNRAPLLILEHSIVFVSARVQNTHFHRGWRNLERRGLWSANLQFVVRIPRVKYTWNRNPVLTFPPPPPLLPLLPTRGHINILDSFNKGCNEVCSYGRLDYADASSQIDYLPRIHSVKVVPSIRRLVYSSSDIVGQIVELNMGIRGCSVLDSGGCAFSIYTPWIDTYYIRSSGNKLRFLTTLYLESIMLF